MLLTFSVLASQKLELASLLTLKNTKDTKMIAHNENRDVGKDVSTDQTLLLRLRSSLLSQSTTMKSLIVVYIVESQETIDGEGRETYDES